MKRNPQNKSRRKQWLIAVLVPCLVMAGGGGWLVASTSGLQWLVGIVESQSRGLISAKGISGTLMDTIGIQKLVLSGEEWRITFQDVRLQWLLAALLRGELKVLHLYIRQTDVLTYSSDTPFELPDSLRFPLDVVVSQMSIDSFSVFHGEETKTILLASGIEANFVSDARHHSLQISRAHLPYGDFSGSGEIATAKPYVLKAQASLDKTLQLSGRSEHAHVVGEANGELQHIGITLRGKGAGMDINGSAEIAPFSVATVSRLQLNFSGLDLGRFIDGFPPALLSGSANLLGKPDGLLEGSVQMRNTNAAALDRKGLPVNSLTAQVRMSSSLVQLQQIDARLLGDANITGEASWKWLRRKASAKLKVSGLNPVALDIRLPQANLQGDIMIDGSSVDQHVVVSLNDDKLALQGELLRHGDQIDLSTIRIMRGNILLTGYGQLVMDRRRSFRFVSKLHKLDLSEFASVPSTDLNVGLEVSGTLLPEAQGNLQLNLSDSHFAQYDISGNGHIDFSGMRRAKGEIALKLGDNHLSVKMAHGTGSDSVGVMLDAPNLAQLGNGLDGQLYGQAELSGSLEIPRLQFSATGKNLKLPGGQQIKDLNATGDLADAVMKMNLAVKDLRNTGGLNLSEASLDLQGNRGNHNIHASARIAKGEEDYGEWNLKANGGLSDPALGWKSLQWRGEINELSAQGMLPFKLLKTVPLSLAKGSMQIGAADMAIAGGQVQLTGMQWTPQHWHSAGHFSGINVRAVNLQKTRPALDAFDFMRIGGSWELNANEHWQGGLQIKRESGDWVVDGNTSARLGLNDLQMSVRAEQDQLHAQVDASGEHFGEVKLRASMPLSHSKDGWKILPEAPLAGSLRLHSDDLSWLGPLLDNNLQSGGRLNFDAELKGTLLSPRLQGEARGDGLSLVLLDQGIRLEQGELITRFESDVVYVDRLAFSTPYQASPHDALLTGYKLSAGNGQLSASGIIDMKGGSGDLNITADHMPLAQRNDRWIIASGKGHARYASKTLKLEGNIRADAGLIDQPVTDRPRYSEDVQIVGQEPVGRIGPPRSVDGTLDLGDHFYIRASGFEGRLAGQLKVHGEPGESLRVTGLIAAQDALFDAYGQHLQVERGMVNFQGPLDDPGLNILALRKGLDVEAGVEVTGTVRHPLVRLVSTPNVPDGEKLSWIVLGRVPETSGVDSALLLAAAGSILGSQSGGQLGKALGVDEISLSQQAGLNAEPVQKVTVGKRLSSRARLSYEQNLNEVGSITKFTYTLTPRITIVTRTGTEDAVDIFYTFRFY